MTILKCDRCGFTIEQDESKKNRDSKRNKFISRYYVADEVIGDAITSVKDLCSNCIGLAKKVFVEKVDTVKNGI